MTRWEFMALRRITGATYAITEIEWLCGFGERGWELAAVRTDGPGTVYYFKRPLIA